MPERAAKDRKAARVVAPGGKVARTQLKRPAPLREMVYDQLAEMIIAGELEPGQHLAETDLAELLGVSRQPVREALLRLQNEGWVDLRPAFGAFVHVPAIEEADQLLSVRTLLEGESARLAALNAKPEQIDQLHGLLQVGQAAVEADDEDALLAANAALHSYVVLMSGNKVLADLIASVDRRVRWYFTPVARVRLRNSWPEHAELVDAISSRNDRRAEDLMRSHTERTRDLYLQNPDGFPH